MKRIYLDYAATSPIKPEVLTAMRPYFTKKFGNPSSIYSFGRETRAAIDKAREQVAEFLNCQPEEIIFTSGGTESDNLAIRGLISSIGLRPRSNRSTRSNRGDWNEQSDRTNEVIERLPHIITSAFEHHAVLHTCQDLEKQGLAEVTYIKPDKEGIIQVEDVKKAIKKNTVLVSIIYVNNEIGTVQPIREIGKLVEKINKQQRAKGIEQRVDNPKRLALSPQLQQLPLLFHTDAVQAIEYFNCDVKHLHVDLFSLSAHKFGGPKGIGALFIKKGTPIRTMQTGGAQEFKVRAGTENVPGIIGLGKALRLCSGQAKSKVLIKLRDYFIDQVMNKIPDVALNGSREKRSPNNINFSFKNAEGESILLNLDLLGIAASSGSACTSGSLEPSHVLRAIGVPDELSHGSVRFTLGEKTTKEEIDYTIKHLMMIVKKLRTMSPYK